MMHQTLTCEQESASAFHYRLAGNFRYVPTPFLRFLSPWVPSFTAEWNMECAASCGSEIEPGQAPRIMENLAAKPIDPAAIAAGETRNPGVGDPDVQGTLNGAFTLHLPMFRYAHGWRFNCPPAG